MDWLCYLAPGLDKTYRKRERLNHEAGSTCVQAGGDETALVWENASFSTRNPQTCQLAGEGQVLPAHSVAILQ
jgi:hypothetical protein